MTEGLGAGVPRSIRVLGPHERARFTPDAWGYLMGLTRSGVLEQMELEQVIDRVLAHFDGRIALSDLRGALGDSSDAGDDGVPPSVIMH